MLVAFVTFQMIIVVLTILISADVVIHLRYTPPYVFEDIITKLNLCGFSNKRIDRALNFKSGYCDKLKTKGSWDSCDIALFTLLKKFPFLIIAAEYGYVRR